MEELCKGLCPLALRLADAEIEEQKEAVKLSDVEERRIFLTREKVKRQHLIKKIREEIRDIEEQIKSLN